MSLSAGQKCILATFLLTVGYDSSLASKTTWKKELVLYSKVLNNVWQNV